MLPGYHPVKNSNLKCSKTFGVLILSLYHLPVEQVVDIEQVKIDAQPISRFFYYRNFDPATAEIAIPFLYYLPIVTVEIFSSVHRHYQLGNMPRLIEV